MCGRKFLHCTYAPRIKGPWCDEDCTSQIYWPPSLHRWHPWATWPHESPRDPRQAELSWAASAPALVLLASVPWARSSRTPAFRGCVEVGPLLGSCRPRVPWHKATLLSRLLHELPQVLILIIPILLCVITPTARRNLGLSQVIHLPSSVFSGRKETTDVLIQWNDIIRAKISLKWQKWLFMNWQKFILTFQFKFDEICVPQIFKKHSPGD